MSDVLWTPPTAWAESSALWRFQRTAPGQPADYGELWRWSVDELEAFWAKVWEDCGVVASQGYDEVLVDRRMPGARWFPGARLNFAENLLRGDPRRLAVFAAAEGREDQALSLSELRGLVARAQQGLRALGVGPGDRVAGIVPNSVDTLVAMLATTSLGGVWSSCSPDFGPTGIVDRFGQIRPKVLVAADGYRYNGALHALGDKLAAVLERLPTLEHVVECDFVGAGLDVPAATTTFDRLTDHDADEPDFVQLPFDHPLYIMFSSGTTGPPKSIVHGAGGTLLKHLSEHQLQTDLRAGESRVFWFTTCGWMMWNWLVGALSSEATVVLYDGSPSQPDLGALWRLAERAGVTHFGTSPKFLAANANEGVRPAEEADLSAVRAVLSTGSPLNPQLFDWAYGNVKPDMQLASISGGTDILGCFAGGAPTLPVRRGELQARSLGMAVEAWDAQGNAVIGSKGELVCTKPFPSMPIGFWDDPDGTRYHDAYFTAHPGVWTHGDFIEVRPHGGVVIYGRSDTTLNPGGVRIGTAEIYRAVEPMPEIVDSVVVGRPVSDDVEVLLCVVLAHGVVLDADLAKRIRSTIREAATPRHVPHHIFAVSEVPYTISGKKVEKAVQAMVSGEPVDNRDALANPQALEEYATLPL